MDRAELFTIIGVGVATVMLNWAISEKVVRGAIADVRVEMAGLSSKVDTNLGFMREDSKRSVSDIREIVDKGLEARTDEIMRAFMASEAIDTDWLIRISDVPNGSVTAAKMNAIAAKFSGDTDRYALAGKVSYEIRVKSLTDEKALLVQEAWDAAASPNIPIRIFPSAGLSKAPH